ncbi:hypothetical protein [Nocardiopsis trehalosi]|jgi:hypothetical protein|uniref:hypothetical protein n=1 Tax=Nocardiopsis trehalosi TaxID=109329 RepID=UPI00082A765C|nr:hypothetical protein [Nocardiopsis trehalosi]
MSHAEDIVPGGDRRWWYCLRHNTPEQGPGCPDKYRLGPYPDRETAAEALHTVAERNEAWDEQDRD